LKRRYPVTFIISAIMLVASCIISAMMLYNYDRAKFAVAIIPTAVFAVIFFIDLALAEKNSLKFIAKLNEAVGTAENEALYYFETPSVIVDSDFRVLWCNKEFNDQIIPEYDIFGTEIYKAVDIDIKALMLEGAATVFFGDRSFKVGAVATQRYDQKLIFMSFTDITEFAELFSKYKRTRPSVLLLVIDNYEDVLQNFKESEKAQVAAAIETMLEDFMSQTTGVLRKLGHDKFIAVIEEQHLNNIIQSKFEILDKARNISIGEKSSIITLSIGVGRGASTLEESETFAKQALDMCLGRGGDQAAVKTENGFRFFGGVANGVEKKSRAKSRIISNAIQELVHNSDNVYIMGHRFADLDAVGAGAGLAGAVRQAGGEAYFVVDPIKNLAGGLIERLHSEIPDLLITPQQAVENFSENSLLIIVDTHNAELVESRELHDMAVHKIVIDHHRKSVNFIDDAVIFYHEPYSSSASEMVTEVIQYFKNVSFLPQVYAEALLAGIMLDTKNFIMKTGVRTFEAAAYLRKNGADTVKVKGLFTNSIEAYRKKSALISTAEIFDRCAIAVSDSKSDDIRIIAPQAADELLGISGVDASFVIYKTGDVVNISARSLGVMNVQVIMERLGGGGHQTMAAAQLTDVSEQKAKEMLIKVLDQD
jgi:c-di-AMP phosphodiesterase-like protein